jgi:hypothetical protein
MTQSGSVMNIRSTRLFLRASGKQEGKWNGHGHLVDNNKVSATVSELWIADLILEFLLSCSTLGLVLPQSIR